MLLFAWFRMTVKSLWLIEKLNPHPIAIFQAKRVTQGDGRNQFDLIFRIARNIRNDPRE